MTWAFTEESLLIPVRLSNPFLDTYYPSDGLVMAVLDTGFTGFMVVPHRVFEALRLHELKSVQTTGQLADGTSIQLHGAYGILRIPEIRLEDEGLIETNPNIREIILGMRGMRRLRITIDGCRKFLGIERC